MGEDTPAPDLVQALIGALFKFETLPPLDRAKAAPGLIDQAKAAMALARRAAIAEMETGGMRRADIARELGISRSKVTEALAK